MPMRIPLDALEAIKLHKKMFKIKTSNTSVAGEAILEGLKKLSEAENIKNQYLKRV